MGEHLIAREIIEVVAGDSGLATALADRVAAAAPMVAATLKRHLDAAEDGHRRRIERLVLALDPCDPVDFEASLVANLDAALSRALPQQLAGVAAIDPAEDALDLIAAFLTSGFLPWWTSGRPAALAEATETLILAANSENPAVIMALRHLLRGTDAAGRLVRAVPERLLPRLAACLAGVRADDLGMLAIVLTAERRDSDPGAGVTHVWTGILVAAAQDAPPSTAEAFGDEVRAHLARAEVSGEAAPSQRSTRPSAPEAFGDEVRAHLERAEGTDEAIPSQTSRRPSAPDPLGPPAASEPSQPEGRKDDMDRDTGPASKDAGPVDDNWAGSPDTESRPAGELLADLTSPEAVPAVVDSAMTNRHDTRAGGAIGTSEDREPRVALPGRDMRPAGAEPPDHIERPFVRNAAGHRSASSRAVDDPEQRVEAKPAFEHDSIYIEAAGIVILGPFLADCFATAGLIASDGGFVTPAAQHRAVALIDYLATADRNPPEWRLGLAKLLAGMPIDTILATGPLDDAEAAAADALLPALLAELPMLGQLTVDGFRAAWLNRPGLLTVEHGEWLLRVERRGWDVLLERLPWSIEWLQLPWQPEGIRIEW